MTVCVAARSESSIICASDKMITSGDVQFEPPATNKLINVNNSIVIMMAGDTSFQTEIITKLLQATSKKINEDSSIWLSVEYVVDLYMRFRNEAKNKRVEMSWFSVKWNFPVSV